MDKDQTNQQENAYNPDAAQEETLAQRSARLEAEAQKLYQAAGDDSPSPKPLDQEETMPHISDEDASDSSPSENSEADGDKFFLGEGSIPLDVPGLTELQQELAETKDKMMRIAADAENTRRRARKEVENSKKYAVTSFSRDMIQVADNLKRALNSITDEMREDVVMANFAAGIEATERELSRSFERNGIETLNPKDLQFDPNFHEVMFEAPIPDKEPGTVIEVIEVGYTLHGRLLRPARVGVSKAIEAGPNETHNSSGSHLDTEI